MTPAILLDGVHVSHEGRCVLHDIRLSCPDGGLLLLLGPNGGGKTTLLRTMAGLQQPEKGTVTLFGLPPRDYASRHGIGYVPQKIAALEAGIPASVHDVLQSACIAHCPGGSEHDGHQARVIADLHLQDIVHRPMHTLSGGERQKVFIARALLSGSKLLFLDEPTNAVDQESQQGLQELLLLLHKRGVTIVVVSHDPSSFADIATDAYCIDGTATKEDPRRYAGHIHHAHAH